MTEGHRESLKCIMSNTFMWSTAVSYPPGAPPAHPVQTAPTSGEMTALMSTPECQTYKAGRQGT